MKKIWIVATFDTKAEEANYLRDLLISHQLPVITADLSTSIPPQIHVDITAKHIAAFHPDGPDAIFSSDRGAAVATMSEAFINFILTRDDVGAILGIGGSGGTAMITKAMQALPIGIPKFMLSTVASGNVANYVGVSDISMMHTVTDLAGLNRISKPILTAAAGAVAGAFSYMSQFCETEKARSALGMTMFGVTTPCVNQVTRLLNQDYDCLVFHATGTGGRAMEKILDDGLLSGLIDLTTTEVADYLYGGVLPCTADRFGSLARTEKPAIISLGALDMINFGALDSVPNQYRHRLLYKHNSEVTLMRTNAAENATIGAWIANRLNQCAGHIRLLIPEKGLSALDAAGQTFWNPEANQALFKAIEKNLQQTDKRQLIRVPYHINSVEFAFIVTEQFAEISRAY